MLIWPNSMLDRPLKVSEPSDGRASIGGPVVQMGLAVPTALCMFCAVTTASRALSAVECDLSVSDDILTPNVLVEQSGSCEQTVVAEEVRSSRSIDDV